MPDSPLGPDSGGESTGGLVTSAGSASIPLPMRAPQITRNTQGKVNMYRLGERVIMNTKDLDVVNVTVTNLGAAVFPSCTFEQQVSADGFNFRKLTGSTDITVPSGTLNVIPSAGNATVQGWAWYAVAVSSPATPDTNYQFARIEIQGKSNT